MDQVQNTLLKNVNNLSLSETAYEKIYRHIVSLEYEPGQILVEKEICEQLGIGRTPIREALQRLSTNGMVEMHPNKALVVRPITLQDTKAMFEALSSLELAVADLVLLRDFHKDLKMMEEVETQLEKVMDNANAMDMVEANYQFHMCFYRASKNEYLIHGLKRVRFEAERLAFLSYSGIVGGTSELRKVYQKSADEHQVIMNCIKNKDLNGLKNAICDHIDTFRNRIVTYLIS